MNDAAPRSLGWGMFLLQFVSVSVVYLLAALPIALIWGEPTADGSLALSSAAVASSVAASMGGALLTCWLWLRTENAVGRAWNLRTPPAGWAWTIGAAAIATIAIIGWFSLGAISLRAIGLPPPDVGEVLGWVTQSQFHFILWIVLVAVLAAGLGEELLLRGFLIDRLERLRGLQGRMWPIILLQAAIFGSLHIYQGLSGAIITGVAAVIFGWLRYRSEGNLWACVIAHIAVDVIMMSLAYAEKLGVMPVT